MGNGVSAAQFEQPAVQLPFRETVAAGVGVNASSVVIVSSSRRDVSVVFLIETYAAAGGVGEYLGSGNFVQYFNQAVSAKGVVGLVLQASSISVVGSSSDASADDDSGKLSTTILIVIIVSSVVFVFATGAVVLYFKAPCKTVAPAIEQQDAVEKQKDECSIGIEQSQH